MNKKIHYFTDSLAILFLCAACSSANADITHGSRYESDGSGGLIYVAYIRNSGPVAITCDVSVSGSVWKATGGAQNMQSRYSDNRRVVVYPGREGTARFSRVVAKSGQYDFTCDQS